MFQSALKSGARRIALLTALTALMVGFGASSAFASVELSPGGPYTSVDEIFVSGERTVAAAEATHVAIVVCNVSEGEPAWGTRCDAEAATPGFVPIASYETPETIELTIQRGPWAEFNFAGKEPIPTGEETTCFSISAAAGADCGVVVSYYKVGAKGAVTHLDAEMKEIEFI